MRNDGQTIARIATLLINSHSTHNKYNNNEVRRLFEGCVSGVFVEAIKLTSYSDGCFFSGATESKVKILKHSC